MSDSGQNVESLLELLRSFGSCVVAFSGGVDSAVVAKAARLALGPNAWAITADSPSLAGGELDQAKKLAESIGIRHYIIATAELQNSAYSRNGSDRCFHCKDELYTRMTEIASRRGSGSSVLVNGTNADDLGDYRPGLQAAGSHSVRSPLAECGFDKAMVRDLAKQWHLPVWDKPATPCLSSRIAYGQQVTPQRLAKIDSAEQFLRSLGIKELRVRFHEGELARIEVPVTNIESLCQPDIRQRIVEFFRQLGFKFVCIDLAGFQSGGLNNMLPVETLVRQSSS